MAITKRPVYPEPPHEELLRWMRKQCAERGWPLQPDTHEPGQYPRGFWVTPYYRGQALVRFRGNGSREHVERALTVVAEVLDELGVQWEWAVPDGRFAALAVFPDPRLWKEPPQTPVVAEALPATEPVTDAAP